MIGRSRCLAMLLASIVLSRAALADPRSIAEKDRQVARDMVKRAIARSEAGDHAGAIKIYQLAYELAPNALLLSNIGAEYQQDNQLEEALKYFCMYLEKDPAGTNAPYATAQARILQSQLGNKVTGGEVCAPRAPKPPEDEAAPVEQPTVQAEPKVIPAAAPARPLPDAPSPGASGNAVLRYIGIASGIAGVVALGVGSYDAYQVKYISDRLGDYAMGIETKRLAGWPSDTRDLQRSGQHYEDLEIRFLIAGGVLVTTGVVLYLVGRPDSPAGHDKPAVAITPTSHGMAVFGRF